MRINKIVIKNFRSVEAAEIAPGSFNFFVGQNNHGKTNFFDAIDYFYNGLPRGETIDKVRFNRENDRDVEVSIEFSDLKAGLENMKNEKNKTTMTAVLQEHDSITLVRKNDDKFQIFVGGKALEKNPTGFDNAIKDFLPRLEYVSTRKYFDDVGKFDKKTPIGIMLSGVLEAIIEKNEKYQELKTKFSELFEGEGSTVFTQLKSLSGEVEVYLQKQFPDCSSVRFEISPPEFTEYLKNFETHVNDGVETTVSEKGDGMQRALMLAIIQTYADHRKRGDDMGKPFIFLIDEAELHLHPTGQRKLKKALYDICSNGDQVFVSTHSSVMITDSFEKQKMFKVEKIEKATYISAIENETDRQNIIYDLLGGSPTDLLLPPNFLIVEGESDKLFLEGVIHRFYSEMPSVKILTANGFASNTGKVVDAINKIYAPLAPIYGDKVTVLLDQPNSKQLSEFAVFKKIYDGINNSGRLFTLTENSLEDAYPAEIVGARSKTDKIKLAKYISQNISKDGFEGKMPLAFAALKKAWELSYGNVQPTVEKKKAA